LVFGAEIKTRFLACRSLSYVGGLRLLLNLDSSDLVKTPFELLHDENGFLAFSDVRIERIFDDLPERETQRGPFRRLLVVLAEPQDQQLWGHDEYIKRLTEVVAHVPGLQCVPLLHATKNQLLNELRNQSPAGGRLYDAVYIVAHGEARPNGDGVVFLEGANHESDPVEANTLGVALQNQPGCFVYLNSCSTALPMGDNPFSGVAQRLMRDGNCGAVLAMQQPIPVEQALATAKSFFDDLARGKNFEEAAHWAVKTQGSANSWAIPCLYTHPFSADQERRDRIAAFLTADPYAATFAFYHPTFCMGYPESLYSKLADAGKITVLPDTFHYKGRTHARTDVLAAVALHSLVCQILPRDRSQTAIHYLRPDQFEDNTASHVFLFGSKSLDLVGHVLKNYSKSFAPSYGADYWQFEDRETGRIYRVENPSRYIPGSDERQAAEQMDYAVIEKIVVPDTDRVYFVMSGLQDRGTRGAGEYLAKHWERLVKEHGAASFRLMLQFAPNLGTQGVAVVERKIPLN